jgi:N-carbamoylputrescine amidase
MSRNVRCGLIQARNALGSNRSLPEIKKAMIDKHLKLIEQAAKRRVKILCLQELFYGPYFCAEQDIRWYDLTERVPNGPTTQVSKSKRNSAATTLPRFPTAVPELSTA